MRAETYTRLGHSAPVGNNTGVFAIDLLQKRLTSFGLVLSVHFKGHGLLSILNSFTLIISLCWKTLIFTAW
jgi:hypothetical protein